jgi:hypothetical protein
MKIFNRDGKINFVDDHNVLVGFDYEQCCCESFGYSITREIPQEPSDECLSESELDGFQFDREFFQTGGDQEEFDCGGCVTFKLDKGSESVFLTLYNSHNGYYSHGFEMNVGNECIREGSL